VAFDDVEEFLDRNMLVDAAHAGWRGPVDNRRNVLVAPQPRVGAAEADHRGRVDAGDFSGIGAHQLRQLGVGRAPARRVEEDLPVRRLRVGRDDLVDLGEDLWRVEPVRQSDVHFETAL